jgi:trimethylamine--corrinoid protein Co-methyltransferase
MPFEALNGEDRARIHDGALRVLEEVGLQVTHRTMLERLRDLGFKTVDGGDRIRLPRATVEAALKKAPRSVRLGARGPGRAAVLDGTRVHTATDGCGSKAIDLESGQKRPSALADVAASARLADALDQFDIYWMMISAQDVPRSTRVPVEYFTALRNTGKHVQMIDMAKREEAELLVRMARALTDAGVVDGPPVSALISVVSPLRLDPDGTEAALVFAEAGLPIVACSMPIASVTSPATAAGNLLLAHAESMAFITILQSFSPGAPVIYCSFASYADARTGTTNYGDPRSAWTAAAAAQLGRSLEVPTFSSGGLLAMMTRPDIMSGGGLLETSTVLSYEQMVIENENLRDCRLAASAAEVSPESLAVEIIRDVGPGGHYLTQKHTVRHMKEFAMSKFVDSGGEPAGQTGGARARALKEARRLLESHKVAPLPAELDAALERIAGETVPSAPRR